jgi:hypothetical protein
MAFREIWCLQRNFDLAKLYQNFPEIYSDLSEGADFFLLYFYDRMMKFIGYSGKVSFNEQQKKRAGNI